MRRVRVVGKGLMFRVQDEVVRALPDVRIASILAPNLEAAYRLAVAFNLTQAHGSVHGAIERGGIDAAHVLVPPDACGEAAIPWLEVGKPVLLEKPLAASSAECASLSAAGRRSGVMLGANRNPVLHPAFARLRHVVAAGRLGRPAFIDCVHNLSLRRMATKRSEHWMFRLEQTMHPLSQAAAPAGPEQDLRAVAGAPVEVALSSRIHPTVAATLACTRIAAQHRLAAGQWFAFWQVSVVCDDGVAIAEILASRVYSHTRTRWLNVVNGVLPGGRADASRLSAGGRYALDFFLSARRLKTPRHPLRPSMFGSVGAFHCAFGGGADLEADGTFGAMLVTACEQFREEPSGGAPAPPIPRPAPSVSAHFACDVADLCGAGFIGTPTVKRFLLDGLRVSMMARSTRNLPAVSDDRRVGVRRGDIRDAGAVALAIGNAPDAVNLAHGGVGTPEQVEQAMVGGPAALDGACMALKARRLVPIGSIAPLHLRPQPDPVTCASPLDPRSDRRLGHARAKGRCDRSLWNPRDARTRILRRGLAVGDGSSPVHGGLLLQQRPALHQLERGTRCVPLRAGGGRRGRHRTRLHRGERGRQTPQSRRRCAPGYGRMHRRSDRGGGGSAAVSPKPPLKLWVGKSGK